MQERVELGFVFQPFQFLSTIGKNVINFLTPGPEIFPKTVTTTVVQQNVPYTFKFLEEAPGKYKITSPVPVSPELYMGSTTQGWQQTLDAVMKAIGAPLSTIANFFTSKTQAEAAVDIAKTQLEAQKAAQAVAEAQLRAQEYYQEQQKGALQKLIQDTAKKAAPYAIPIAVGLGIMAILLLSRRKE